MNKNLLRAKVVLTALPTRMVAVAAAITVGAAQLALVLPQYAAGITRWSVTVVGCLGAATVAIRKLTPVGKDQEGLLLQAPPASPIVVIDKPSVD